MHKQFSAVLVALENLEEVSLLFFYFLCLTCSHFIQCEWEMSKSLVGLGAEFLTLVPKAQQQQQQQPPAKKRLEELIHSTLTQIGSSWKTQVNYRLSLFLSLSLSLSLSPSHFHALIHSLSSPTFSWSVR
jgi:hypothetical protein